MSADRRTASTLPAVVLMLFALFVPSQMARSRADEPRRVAAPAAMITEYPLPTPGARPVDISLGPDGQLWFVETGDPWEAADNKIGRITTAGEISEFALPAVSEVAAAADGNLWFLEWWSSKFGRLGADGSVTRYAFPTTTSTPFGLIAGPDGNLWFLESFGARTLGRITMDGQVNYFPLPSEVSSPTGLTTGPDGALWFALNTCDASQQRQVGRMTTAGAVSVMSLPESQCYLDYHSITTGPDNQLWLLETNYYDPPANKLIRLGLDGSVTRFAASGAWTLTSGPDQALWFIDRRGNTIGRIDLSGAISRYIVPTAGSELSSITSGPDGAIWFTEDAGNRIGRLDPAAPSYRTLLPLLHTPGAGVVLERLNLGIDNSAPDEDASEPAVSADGRFVVFASKASNLVAGDNAFTEDVFLVDRRTRQVELISADASTAAPAGSSSPPAVSDDGRYVVFGSRASTLVAGDTNAAPDIFLRDRQMGETHRISINPSGAQANDGSGSPAISADGRCIAFSSAASNLVSGDTNAASDIFVVDRQTNQLERVSRATGGVEANDGSGSPAISADGRFVAFGSRATNLTAEGRGGVFVHDREQGTTELVSAGAETPGISADGRFVTFSSRAADLVSGDTNELTDVFVVDRQTGETRLVSRSSDGSQANEIAFDPVISASGRYIAFASRASTLVAEDTNRATDIFVYDYQTQQTRRASVTVTAEQANDYSSQPALSADGGLVVFRSWATNLVPGAGSGWYSSIYLRERP